MKLHKRKKSAMELSFCFPNFSRVPNFERIVCLCRSIRSSAISSNIDNLISSFIYCYMLP